MADGDMFDYILHITQPPLPKPRPPAPPPAPAPTATAAQARAKKERSLTDLRAWWAELPESEKQAVRNKQFIKPNEKKKPEDKPKPKPSPAPAKPNAEPYISRKSYLC